MKKCELEEELLGLLLNKLTAMSRQKQENCLTYSFVTLLLVLFVQKIARERHKGLLFFAVVALASLS